MKVLIVHNRYRSDVPSGENAVVDAEIAGLRDAGVEVVTHLRSSDEIATFSARSKAMLPLRPFHSAEDVGVVSKILSEQRPDILHLHNANPLISMSVVDAAHASRIPVVLTVHNHRHACINGAFFRDGHACHDCQGRTVPWPGVVHGCYRDSRLQSLTTAGALAVHQRSYRKVSLFLAVSETMRRSLVDGGYAAERIVVKPNMVVDPAPDSAAGVGEPARAGRVLYVGRLSEEKGIRLLLAAWARRPPSAGGHLVVVGSGPLEGETRNFAAGRSDVEVTGQLDGAGVDQAIRAAGVVVVPSVWDEPFGLVAIEAYARSRPVLSTGMGGLGDMLPEDSSWRAPATVEAWSAALTEVTGLSAAALAEKGRAARVYYASRYSPPAVVAALLEAYAHAAEH